MLLPLLFAIFVSVTVIPYYFAGSANSHILYRPEQVLNMDDTGLYWKQMPSQTFFFKDEEKASGFKVHKDCVALLMCGNAAGFLLKLALSYKSKHLRALKNKNKNLLLVYWMHNPTAWVTKPLSSDWFHQSFIPQVKVYLLEKGLPVNVLLLLDNTGGHATNLAEDGVRAEFLPANTMSLIQSMDQEVIRAFKALYRVSIKFVCTLKNL